MNTLVVYSDMLYNVDNGTMETREQYNLQYRVSFDLVPKVSAQGISGNG